MNNKLSIITSDNRKLQTSNLENLDYNCLSFYINSLYCKKYKYSFNYYKITDINKTKIFDKDTISLYCRKSKLTKSSPWSKLLVIYKNFFKQNSFIIYMDTDCFFNNHSIDVGLYINEIKQKNKLGMFFNDGPWNSKLPNCGFMIFKNCKYNKMLIKIWWNSFSLYNHVHPYEQKKLQKMWINNYMDMQNKFIFKNLSLQKNNTINKFLLHITSDQKKNRKIVMSNLIKKKLGFNRIKYLEFLKINQKIVHPIKIDEKINGKINFLDLITIEIHKFLTIRLIFFLKKIKNLIFNTN